MVSTEKEEKQLIACCYHAPEVIDQALEAGVTVECFHLHAAKAHWQFVVGLRMEGHEISDMAAYSVASQRGKLGELGGAVGWMEFTDVSSVGGMPLAAAGSLIKFVVDARAKRLSWLRAHAICEGLKAASIDLQEVTKLAGEISELSQGHALKNRETAKIVEDEEARFAELSSGNLKTTTLISWGLPKADKFLMPIEAHEYVLVCARPSRGKSSLLAHLARTALANGQRVAYFTLETSDRSVVAQIASQRAKVNLKHMAEWMPDHRQRYKEALGWLKTNKKNLLIFDKDFSLERISSRCRMLAASFKPQLVLIDYLGLVRTEGKDIYQRVSAVSKAMIPLRKTLGCALVAGQQLNRGTEQQDREPTLGDLRDSGQLEEDAHRVVMLHWKDSRLLDQQLRDYIFLQPKLRDGPTTSVSGIKFHAGYTLFEQGD